MGLGFHEPLNPAERFKKDDDGLHVRDRIVNRYAHLGFDSIDPQDLRGRFRWWGLYTQRKPGIGGGKTGALEDAEIEDPYFMMRVRIPGGQLEATSSARSPDRQEYGRDLADHRPAERAVRLDRHRGRARDLGPAGGSRPVQPAGLRRRARNILGCPVAGIDAAEVLDASVVLRATEEIATNSPDLTNLPRSSRPHFRAAPACARPMRSTTSRSSASSPDGKPGYDWVGGGLSTNPMLAQRLGTFAG